MSEDEPTIQLSSVGKVWRATIVWRGWFDVAFGASPAEAVEALQQGLDGIMLARAKSLAEDLRDPDGLRFL